MPTSVRIYYKTPQIPFTDLAYWQWSWWHSKRIDSSSIVFSSKPDGVYLFLSWNVIIQARQLYIKCSWSCAFLDVKLSFGMDNKEALLCTFFFFTISLIRSSIKYWRSLSHRSHSHNTLYRLRRLLVVEVFSWILLAKGRKIKLGTRMTQRFDHIWPASGCLLSTVPLAIELVSLYVQRSHIYFHKCLFSSQTH